jgi:hypothetical protein
MKNMAIINAITDSCVTDGKIDNFMVKMLKEVYLVSEYTEYQPIVDEDGDLEIVSTFEDIRNTGKYKKFVMEFNRGHLEEFEELLELELNQTARLQLNEKSLVNVLEDFLYNLLAKIPSEEKMAEMMKELPSMINGLDKSKIDGIMSIINKIGKK